MSALTYLILEIIAITSLVLIALRVVAVNPQNRNAWLFAAIFLSNACYVLTRMTFKAEAAYRVDLGLLVHPVQVLTNLGSGLWMIFCYSTFQDRRRVPKLWLLLFALQFVLSLLRIYTVPMSLSELDRNPPGAVTRILLLESAAAVARRLWRVRAGDGRQRLARRSGQQPPFAPLGMHWVFRCALWRRDAGGTGFAYGPCIAAHPVG